MTWVQSYRISVNHNAGQQQIGESRRVLASCRRLPACLNNVNTNNVHIFGTIYFEGLNYIIPSLGH